MRPILPYREARQAAIDRFERDYLVELLRESGSSVAAMSRLSGLSRKYVRVLLLRHDLRDQVSTSESRLQGPA
jgi:hypothetical protein